MRINESVIRKIIREEMQVIQERVLTSSAMMSSTRSILDHHIRNTIVRLGNLNDSAGARSMVTGETFVIGL